MKTQKMSLSDIRLDERNARTHDARNLETIANSLDRFGQQKPIVIDGNGVVIAGNGTVEAARSLGWEKIQVVKTDLTGTDARAFAIADNRTSDLSDWHYNTLIEELGNFEADMQEAIGFSEEDIAELIQSPLFKEEEVEVEEDETPEPSDDPTTKPGDLILLGEHRLLCGDSTNADDVARLMDGEMADMMFTDPPYGVDYDGGHFHSGNVNIKRAREKLQDDDSTDIYFAFLPVALPVVDGPCYMWHADSKARDVYNAVHDNECVVHALIVWHKTNATYAAMNAQYKQRHEPCLYFKPKGSTLRWCGATTEATVWNQDRDGINDFHPTQKPVALAAKAIGNHEATIILDAFLGSGSTLIAAEQLSRKCYGLEIDPAYCDVIVQRWENLTGGTVERIREDD